MRYIAGGDHPRLRCLQVHPPAMNPRLEWQVPPVYAMAGLRIPGVAGDDDDDDDDDDEDPEAAYYRTRHDYD
jgi:hypothetical protein